MKDAALLRFGMGVAAGGLGWFCCGTYVVSEKIWLGCQLVSCKMLVCHETPPKKKPVNPCGMYQITGKSERLDRKILGQARGKRHFNWRK